MGRKFGFSWSWKRAVGLSSAKAQLSRELGVPLTSSGRQKKMGRMMGCCIQGAILLTVTIGLIGAFMVIGS